MLTRQRELRFEGLSVLEESDLIELVPFNQSIAWWKLNRQEVVNELRKHPLVRLADIHDCPDVRIGCAIIQVVERRPSFVAIDVALGDAGDNRSMGWVVAHDGSFIVPLSAEQREVSLIEIAGKPFSDLPQVSGIQLVGGDAQVVSARARYVAESLPILSESFGSTVRSAVLNQQGELHVSFSSLNFPVTFDQDEADPVAGLLNQTARLRAVLNSLGADIGRVQSIDLGFKRLGVVKFQTSGGMPSRVRK